MGGRPVARARSRQRPNLDLISIRGALAAAEHRSLRRAAAAIGMSESALSLRVRGLEEALAVSLFHRSSEGVAPTHAGAAFLLEARRALNLLDIAATTASAAGGGARGRLTIGFHTALSIALLGEPLSLFKQAHPDLDLRMTQAGRSELVEGLAARSIDLAIMIGLPDSHLGEAMPLAGQRLHWVVPHAHRLARHQQIRWADIGDEIVLAPGQGAGSETVAWLMSTLDRPGWTPRIRTHAVKPEALPAMVGLGFGLSLMIGSDLGGRRDGVMAIPFFASDAEAVVPITAYRDAGNDNPPLRRLWSLLTRRRRSAD